MAHTSTAQAAPWSARRSRACGRALKRQLPHRPRREAVVERALATADLRTRPFRDRPAQIATRQPHGIGQRMTERELRSNGRRQHHCGDTMSTLPFDLQHTLEAMPNVPLHWHTTRSPEDFSPLPNDA